SGSVQVGKFDTTRFVSLFPFPTSGALVGPYSTPNTGVSLATVLVGTGADYYQVIRTGTGDIDISAGRDVQLRNPFATIYTAGTQVANPASVMSPNDFFVPALVSPQAINPQQDGLTQSGFIQENFLNQQN